MKQIFTLITSVILFGHITAQDHHCATMDVDQRLRNTDPGYAQRRAASDQHAAFYAATLAQHDVSRAVIKIPVVFHVVFENATENISDAQIMSQLAVLNEDYRKLNANFSQTPSVFQGLGADFEFEFCLATEDPAGNPTTGITRTQTSNANFASSSNDDKIKFTSQGGFNAWNANKYLNIWVCDLGSGLLGYAQFPGGPNSTDGVVLTYTSVGRPPANTFNTPYNLGRTATHEVGHWLNLYHIWGNEDSGCGNQPGSTGTDEVSDTPVQDQANYQCPPFPHVTCNNGPNGDHFMNYMDYGDDDCLTMFTTGQKTRSRALFANGGARVSLLTSAVCSTVPTPVGACSDTLRFPLTGTVTVYGDQTTGYVSGTNTYNDSTKADKFTAAAPFTVISGGLFGFFDAQNGGLTNYQVTFRLYDDNGAAQMPGTILASATVPIATIIANVADGAYTTVTFPTPVAVTGNFYLGYVVNPASGVVLSLFSNTDGDANPNTAFEQFEDGSWHAFSEQGVSWGLSVSQTIHPILSSPAPTVSFSVSDNSVCAGNTVSFISAATGAAGFSWSFPGGTPSSASTANANVVYSAGGSYGATLVVNGGCSGQTATSNQNNVVTVASSPQTPVITNNAGVLASSVTGGSFQWFLNGNAVSGATNSTFTPTATGNYTVTVTQGGCSATSAAINVNTVGIPTTGAFNVNLFPNPVSGILNISTGYSAEQEHVSCSVFDLSGKLVLSKQFKAVKPGAIIQVDLSGISNGIYRLVIDADAGRQNAAVAVTH